MIVGTEKVSREAMGPYRDGWKGDRPWVRLKEPTGETARSPNIMSGPIFRATTPLSRGQLKSKGHGKLSINNAADQETIETIFRIIVSANQLSLYKAVAEMWEEYESFHERTGRLDKVMGQSIVLSEIKTEVPLDNIKTFYHSNMKNELRGFHKKID